MIEPQIKNIDNKDKPNNTYILLVFLYFIFVVIFGITIFALIKTGWIKNKVTQPIVEYLNLQKSKSESELIRLSLVDAVKNKKDLPSNSSPQNTKEYTQQPIEPVCYRVEVKEGEYKSNKCYTWDDHAELKRYVFELYSNTMSLESAERRIEMTCEVDSEQARNFLKDSCEDAREDKKEAEDNIEKYENKIKEMVSKGWD